MNKYPLAISSWDQKEINAIKSVIDSNNYTMGKHVKNYEKNFAEYVGSKYCVMVNSGSSANLLVVAALFYTKVPKLNRGDEVIVPAVSWSTTYMPLQQYGLKLKFVDIDLNTLNYNLHELENAVSDKTKMMLVVNLLGNPNNFDKIDNIIKNKDIILIEDNCESLGATYKGRFAGTFGLMGTYSSFFSHHISTMEGGMIVTEDEALYHILLSLREHGWTRNLPKKNHISTKSDNWFKESFNFVLPGYNLRPLEISGAIGIEQLKKLSKFITIRKENANVFLNHFHDHPDYYVQCEIGNSSWFGFSLIIKPESNLKRSDIIRKLQKNYIECRPIVSGDFTQNRALKYFKYEIHGNLINAKYMHENGFFVGNSHIDLKENIVFLKKILS